MPEGSGCPSCGRVSDFTWIILPDAMLTSMRAVDLFRSHPRGGEAVRASLPSSGDTIPAQSGIIALYIRDLDQLFNLMDPSPFPAKALGDEAEEYIVASARELPRRSPAALVVYLDKAAGAAAEGKAIGDAVRAHFARKEQLLHWELRELIHRGLISLVLGLGVLSLFLTVGEVLRHRLEGTGGSVLATSLHIGGWVAMWHPMEVFIYEWWPIVAKRRLMCRLSRTPIQIVYTGTAADATGTGSLRRDDGTASCRPDLSHRGLP